LVTLRAGFDDAQDRLCREVYLDAKNLIYKLPLLFPSFLGDIFMLKAALEDGCCGDAWRKGRDVGVNAFLKVPLKPPVSPSINHSDR